VKTRAPASTTTAAERNPNLRDRLGAGMGLLFTLDFLRRESFRRRDSKQGGRRTARRNCASRGLATNPLREGECWLAEASWLGTPVGTRLIPARNQRDG